MRKTNTLIIGASISGLSCAACLQKEHIDYLLIEKEKQVATPWRKHYERLHLHTNKRVSGLPFKKFERKIPRYPDKKQVIEYLEKYQQEFDLQPVFNTKVIAIERSGDFWKITTSGESFLSKYVIVATGAYGSPKPVDIKGMGSFPGRIIHSIEYQTGKEFTGQKVLVIGFGNSSCEIAIDLYEQKAIPSMSVRSPVNVIPRDILNVPVLELSLLLNRFSPRFADKISAPLIRWHTGDINSLGLQKMPYGPLEQIRKDGKAPVLDIGTLRHIRKGNIKILGEVDFLQGKQIHFKNGISEEFDAIIAGIGYQPGEFGISGINDLRMEDLRQPVQYQKYFGLDGLYFCGFWISPTGQIREIARDARIIAKDIAGKERFA